MGDVAKSLEQALDQIEAFKAIHEPGGVPMDAVMCLQESVGIDDDSRVLIRERLYESGDGGSHEFLGVIIGLLAARMEADAAG